VIATLFVFVQWLVDAAITSRKIKVIRKVSRLARTVL